MKHVYSYSSASFFLVGSKEVPDKINELSIYRIYPLLKMLNMLQIFPKMLKFYFSSTYHFFPM